MENHTRQEWNVLQDFRKSRAEFTAKHGIAAICSAVCWKLAIFVYQISAHAQNIPTYRKHVGVKEYS